MMFLIDLIYSTLAGIYWLVFDLVMWFFNGMVYMVTDPEGFFTEYGLIIALLSILVITVLSLGNWATKRYLFQRVYMAPPDKPRSRRFIGRKLFFLKNGAPVTGLLYNLKFRSDPEEREKFDGLLYFVYPKTIWKIPIGFSADHILIPKDENRTTWKMKTGIRWKRDIIIYYKGMKEYHKLGAKIASDKSKGTTKAVGPDWFTQAGKQKIDLADKLAQMAVTANAESQQYQLALGSIPHNQRYKEMSDEEITSVYLQQQEDKDISPEEVTEKQIDRVLQELEVTGDA